MNEIKVGDVFGRLEVIALHNDGARGFSWLCRCECGNEVIKANGDLIPSKRSRGHKSCGCSLYAHNGLIMKNKRLYDIWYAMKRRCENENNGSYERYGAVGASYCDEWKEYENFYEWTIKNGYKKGLTLDRIDTSKPYSPENCRWVDYYFQNQNKKIFHNNTTGYTGVSYDKKRKKYVVSIRRNDLQLNLGSYEDVESAARARERAEDYFKNNKTLVGYKR